MPNAKTQCQGPNTTYIPLAGVGVLCRERHKFFFFGVFSDTNMLVYQRKIMASGVIAHRSGIWALIISVIVSLKNQHCDLKIIIRENKDCLYKFLFQAQMVKAAFQEERALLVIASTSKQPNQVSCFLLSLKLDAIIIIRVPTAHRKQGK